MSETVWPEYIYVSKLPFYQCSWNGKYIKSHKTYNDYPVYYRIPQKCCGCFISAVTLQFDGRRWCLLRDNNQLLRIRRFNKVREQYQRKQPLSGIDALLGYWDEETSGMCVSLEKHGKFCMWFTNKMCLVTQPSKMVDTSNT